MPERMGATFVERPCARRSAEFEDGESGRRASTAQSAPFPARHLSSPQAQSLGAQLGAHLLATPA